MSNYAVIMAGGSGTRFWPKGTTKLPKQFLKISHDTDTMLQATFRRIQDVFRSEHVFVVTNALHKGEVRKQLPQLPENNIITEPVGRNTAPCIGLAGLFIKQFDEKANILVLASDHLIKDEKEFHRVIKNGLNFVKENGGIVTLGINPTGPETGYGYIQFEQDNFQEIDEEKGITERIYKVRTFAEKPDLEMAKKFLESGDFLWNSGMFIFRLDTMMEEMKRSMPDLYKSLEVLEGKMMSKDFNKVLHEVYHKIKSVSIDYGVMEKSANVHTIKSDFGWNDVGAWDEVYNISEKNGNGNVVKGPSKTIDSNNNMIISEGKFTALIGVEDLLVVDTEHGLLICKRGESQKVKEIVDHLKKNNLEQYL